MRLNIGGEEEEKKEKEKMKEDSKLPSRNMKEKIELPCIYQDGTLYYHIPPIRNKECTGWLVLLRSVTRPTVY